MIHYYFGLCRVNPRNTSHLGSLGSETPSLGSETRDTEKWALRGAVFEKLFWPPKPKPGHFGWFGGLKYIPKNLGKLLGRPPSNF